MIHTGDIELPDGRVVHGQATFHEEWDTGAYVLVEDSVVLEWPDGWSELTVDEMNEELPIVGCYLREYVVDRLAELPGEWPDEY